MSVNVMCSTADEGQSPRTSNQPKDKKMSRLEYQIKTHNEKEIAAAITAEKGSVLAAYRFPAGKRDSDITLMHLAACHRLSWTIMKMILENCPGLVCVERSKILPKQTVLHILVTTKQKTNTQNLLAEVPTDIRQKLLNTSMDTSKNLVSSQTEQLGGLPLSIAALTFYEDMVDILLENGALLYAQNHQSETVFHSLIRYSHHYPEKEKRALEMMKFLYQRLCKKHEPRSVWLLKNEENLTALQLAAQLTQPLLFDYIIRLPLVYCNPDDSDGVYDLLKYDITEIDPAAMKKVNDQKVKNHEEQEHEAQRMEDRTRESAAWREGKSRAPTHGLSVLEIINDTARDFDAKVEILNNHIVNNVVKARWQMWKSFFLVWCVLHLVVMVWYSAYTVYKARRFIDRELGGAERNFALVSAFIFAIVSGFAVVCGLILFIRGLVDTVRRKDGDLCGRLSQLFKPAGVYELLLWIWPFFLFLDSILFLNCWYENESCNPGATTPITTLTLMAGWSICPLFLRPVKMFSFFMVMLREVFVGDILRFLAIFLPALASFSLAMHIIFLPSSPDDLPSCDGTLVVNCTSEDFKTYPRTLLTMFKLMLGLTEIERLLDAPENLQWLAVTIFIVFVLLTYGLMLNALIALMSNTCSSVSKNRDNQWKKERLAVIMFLQRCFPLPCCARRFVGEEAEVKMLDYQDHVKIRKRFTMKIPTKKIEDLDVTSSDMGKESKTMHDPKDKGKSEDFIPLQEGRIFQDMLNTKFLTWTDFVKKQAHQAMQKPLPTNGKRPRAKKKAGSGDSTSGTMNGVNPRVTLVGKVEPTADPGAEPAADSTAEPTAEPAAEPSSQLPGTPDNDTDDKQELPLKYSHAQK